MGSDSRSRRVRSGGDRNRATQLTLKIWHPDCWTLQTTASINAGLLAHSVHEYDGLVNARVTAYADQQADVDALVEEIDESELTNQTERIHNYFNPNLRTDAAGNATAELLVRYPPANSIHEPFLSRGFIPDEEIRIDDGFEYWTVIATASRSSIQKRLNGIRQEMDADIAILGTKSASTEPTGTVEGSELTERQREVLKLARRQGYYAWPRGTSATELAVELNVTKATVLEHLRKAEAKLLDPES